MQIASRSEFKDNILVNKNSPIQNSTDEMARRV
jgi:hypothetical protein